METGFPAADSRDDFARARRNAVLGQLAARLRLREGDVDVLLPFDEVVGALGHRGEQQLGQQSVDLDTIVGSVRQADRLRPPVPPDERPDPQPLRAARPRRAPRGRPAAVGAGNDRQFAALCAAVGLPARPGWVTNPGRVADRVALADALAEVFGRRTAGEWARILDAAGVPCSVVQDLAVLPSDPHIAAVGLVQEVAHPAGPVRVVGSPYRLDRGRPRVRRAPPLLGQHTAEVLTALGLSDAQVEEVTGAHGG